MSQNGTTSATDENRITTTISTPLFVPMVPMYFPFGNPNASAQQFYAPAVYPNVQTYPSTGNHRHGNFGLTYNTYYAPYYPTTNSILPPTAHINNSSGLIQTRPLMAPNSLLQLPSQQHQQQQQPQQLHSSTTIPLAGNDVERNKNLNIRECQSPVLNQIKKEKTPLQIVDPNEINTDSRIRKDSSSASSLLSHSESEQNLLPPSTSAYIQENDSDNPQDDFLTFIEQKTKTAISMPELNPFANEFSFMNNKTLTKDSSITTNGIDHHSDNDNQSSYRLLFDNLIEKSLESIEAIKKSTKKVSVTDASIQCNQIDDHIHRSTQTVDPITNNELLEQYSLRTIKLMDKLLENFGNIYQNELNNQCKTMAHTCDELRHLILFIHHIVSSNKEQNDKTTIDLDNPFIHMIEDLENNMININKYQQSTQIIHNAGRGTRRLMTTINNSPIPSFSCRQIEPITSIPSKLCLLCHRSIDDTDDVMHKICRTLSNRPNMFTNT